MPLVQVLASILQAAPELVFAKDLEGRYLLVNKATLEALGLPMTDVLGRTDHELFPPQVAAGIREWDERTLSSGAGVRYEGAHPLGPGQRVYLTSKAPLLTPVGQTVGLVGVSRDVTDVRRLEENLVRLSRQLADLVCVFSAEGTLRFVSDSFSRVLGWSREEVLGRRQRELVHPDDWPASSQTLRELLAERRPVVDFRNRVRCRDGSYRLLEWRCDPPEPDGAVFAVAREVTERAREEQQLRWGKSEAELLAARRSRFLADMSHEIRTPLNAVLGAVDLASGLRVVQESAELQELLTVAGTAGRALLAVVNDVLDLAKLEADGVELERVPFAPAAPLQDAVLLARGRFGGGRAPVTCEVAADVPPLVTGDPHRLRQVLVNLVDNAIKFSEGAAVTATLHLQAEGTLQYAIADQGRGIPAERLEAIFHPYRQADASDASRLGGTGLGLAISRRLAERMGGSLEARPGAPRGMVFVVTVPVIQAAGQPAPSAVARLTQESPGRGMRVLVAEDEPLNQLIVVRLLEALGCENPQVVADGEAAVLAVESSSWNLVLLDVQMPTVSGLEAVRRIRATHASGAPPLVVALTASATAEVRDACLAAGFDAYLTKPIRGEALATVLRRAAQGTADPVAGDD
jgi:PAS domain S-box-containing protein